MPWNPKCVWNPIQWDQLPVKECVWDLCKYSSILVPRICIPSFCLELLQKFWLLKKIFMYFNKKDILSPDCYYSLFTPFTLHHLHLIKDLQLFSIQKRITFPKSRSIYILLYQVMRECKCQDFINFVLPLWCLVIQALNIQSLRPLWTTQLYIFTH